MSLLDRARVSLAKESADPHARPVLVVEDDAGLRAVLVSVLPIASDLLEHAVAESL